jgi:ankyrin repeat protein
VWLNWLSQYGQTVLMKAAMWGQVEPAKALLERGANLLEKDMFGMTPFLRAAYAGQLDMVKFLLEKGSNVMDVDHVRATVFQLALAPRRVVLWL